MRLLFTFIVYTITFLQVQGQDKDIKDILVLNSYHVGYQWTDDVTQGVIDAFGPRNKTRLFVEYMDFKRFQQRKHFFELEKLYKDKYSEIEIDGIICVDNYAFEFFLNNGDSIWDKDIPVAFCGVNNIENYQYNTKRIKGIKEDIDVRNTLTSLYTLQPNTDSLLIICDHTLSGKFFLSRFLDELYQYNPKIPHLILDGSNYDALKTKLKQISPTNKAIILLSLYTERHNVPVDIKDIGWDLFNDINIPVYSFWDFLIDDLIIGGSLISAYDHGYNTAKILSQRIEDPLLQVDKLKATTHHLIFDYNMIKKYKLNSDLLPANTLFKNKHTPFYVRYKKQLIYFFSALIILVAIIFLLMTNIIKRKMVERRLIESEERLELALNGANEGMWDIQLKSRKVIYNNNLATLLGYESSDELNINLTNWRKLFKADDIPQIKEALKLHLNGLTPIFKLEIQMYLSNYTLHYFSISGKITERDINGIPMRITGIIMDISAQKEFESQLKIAKNKAEESDRLKSSFLANMSHEIRTPMNAILGFSDILMSCDLNPEENRDYLSQIKNSGENLLNIINDIVDISKIESGQLSIRNERFDLHNLLHHVECAGKTLIKSLDKTISFTLIKETTDSPLDICSDPYRLEQILLNLISNAVKFTHEGGIVLKYVKSQNELITFTLSDSGEGITTEDQLIIFERFRQAEKSTQKLHTGTGLGLSITKSLVHLLGGTISVESEPGKGSTFTFTIPT